MTSLTSFAGRTWQSAFSGVHHGGGLRGEHHFATSIDFGPHVAREICRRAKGAPILDLGAGDGRLLRQLRDLGVRELLGVDTRPRPTDLPASIDWIRGVAPDVLPHWDGLLIAHEFLDDLPVVVVRNGEELGPDGPVGPAGPQDLEWISHWGGEESGLSRDEVWEHVVSMVRGTAIAVDWMDPGVVGHLRGRRTEPIPDGRDLSAGVNLRACRARTGGVLMTQARVLAHHRATDLQERAELAMLRNPSGLGSFGWLVVETAQ